MDWEDALVVGAKWQELKPTMRWGQLPALTLPSGETLFQSGALFRFLAKQVKVGGSPLYPADALEAARVDEWLDAFEDARFPLLPTFSLPAEEKAAARTALVAEDGKSGKIFAKLNEEAGKGAGKFLLGDTMTAADVWCFW